ncbi:MAG: hypothetical protein ACYCQJ_05625 [Nitrososphaerales archaeon]
MVSDDIFLAETHNVSSTDHSSNGDTQDNDNDTCLLAFFPLQSKLDSTNICDKQDKWLPFLSGMQPSVLKHYLGLIFAPPFDVQTMLSKTFHGDYSITFFAEPFYNSVLDEFFRKQGRHELWVAS